MKQYCLLQYDEKPRNPLIVLTNVLIRSQLVC